VKASKFLFLLPIATILGIYFQDEVMKLCKNFSGDLQNFQKIDMG